VTFFFRTFKSMIISMIVSTLLTILFKAPLLWGGNLSFGSFSTPSSPLDNPDLLREIVSLAQKVQILCPPEDCYYLGVGRSPTPIVAYFQTINPLLSSTLPLSSFRFQHPYPSTLQAQKDQELRLKEGVLERIYEHFDRFLPQEEQLDQKRILLMDYTVTGMSLSSTLYYVRKYYEERGPSFQVDAVAFLSNAFQAFEMQEYGEADEIERILRKNAPGYRKNFYENIILDRRSPLLRGFFYQIFDSMSEYDSFLLSHSDIIPPKETSLEFLEFRRRLNEKLEGLFEFESLSEKDCEALLEYRPETAPTLPR
jgi:hypothetical protein